MADPNFAEMEAEAESFAPRRPFDGRNRGDKLMQPTLPDEEILEAETAPLLGPPVLTSEPQKRWYNTASVSLF
jgi:hypothetical protein